MNLLITNKRTLQTIRGDEHDFARLTEMEPDDVLWAIDEYERCDANIPGQDEYVCIPEEFER